jgi:hypothetical protein
MSTQKCGEPGITHFKEEESYRCGAGEEFTFPGL